MNVLLINPRQQFKSKNIWKSVMGFVPPLGIAQLGAYLIAKNIKVAIIDANAESLDDNELRVRIKDVAGGLGIPEFIGITATTNTFFQGIASGQIAKEVFPRAVLVAGGIHATILPEDFLKYPFVDFCIRGEGEIPFYELISGKEKTGILSLSYRTDGGLKHNPPAAPLDNLDELPMPAYELLPMKRYRPSLGSYKKLPAIGMVTSRGCPGKCTFCYGQYFGKKVRFRSAETIVNEIKHLKDKYCVKEVSFYDDTFTAVRHNMVKFCEIAAREKLDIAWSCFSRTDLVSAAVLKQMKEAGCHQICFGIESGDEGILNNIKKDVSLETAKEAIRLTKEAGIEARATFMLGNPGETKETLLKTYRFAIDIDPDIALFNITTPFPGTEMFDWASKNGYIKTYNWADYDLSKPVMDIPGLGADEIVKYYAMFNKNFYSRPSYLFKRLLRMRSLSQLKESFTAFLTVFGGRQ